MDVATERSTQLLDNDRVVVKEICMGPGEKMPMHSHPDYVIYSKSPCHVKFTNSDGSSEEVDLQPDQVLFRNKESHEVENLGAGVCDTILVELK